MPRAASEPTYGQAIRRRSGRKRNRNQLCLTNMTQTLWQEIPVQGWCWGAGLPQPPGTPFLLLLSLLSPLSSCLPLEGLHVSLPTGQGEGGRVRVASGRSLEGGHQVKCLVHSAPASWGAAPAAAEGPGVQTPPRAPSARGNKSKLYVHSHAC